MTERTLATYSRLEADNKLLRDALKEIVDITDGESDADDGQPNTAMRCLSIAETALRKTARPDKAAEAAAIASILED